MKYNLSIEIELSIDKVIELFDSFDNMKEWQKGLVSYEHIEGTSGQPGAKTKLHYKMGKREVDMIETITERNLPAIFSATYEAQGVWNLVVNRFQEKEGKTIWETEHEFRFTTIFMKIMGFFMPGAFKKQSYKYMVDFKEYVENAD